MIAEDLDLLAELCRGRAGLRVEVDKTYLIESRLGPLARRESFVSIDAMMVMVRAGRDERLLWAVVEAMTLNDTTFFRDRKVFDHIRDDLLPALARQREGKPVRIWSAACATGQEVYSLAIAAEAVRESLPSARFEFFGSDLSDRCLEKAQSGLYTQFEVQRGLPIRQLIAHFESQDETWTISPRIRQGVRWRRVNLIDDLSGLGRFDMILLRHVLPDLDPGIRRRVLEGLAGQLSRHGVLVLGPLESAAELTGAFQPADPRLGIFTRDPDFRAAA